MFHNYRKQDTFIRSQNPPKLELDESRAVGLLQHLNKAELQNILDNEDKLMEIINDLQQPRFDELKRKLATAYEEANRLKETLAKDKSQLDMMRGKCSLETILDLMKTAAAVSEEESETSFVINKLVLKFFLDTYIKKRTVAHLQQLKAQKMSELINSSASHGQNAQTNYNWNAPKSPTGSAAPYPSAGNASFSGSSMPYPMGGSSAMPYPSSYR
ncbi:hypothetical protein KUTeg_010353 [Tegillarca granosa]|uniref:VPS37 C-terminal domain-containing protein n=1 Tax=Tegillarca granosa TaxID=220873 RepID=A0ABQ9F6G1_TEGGR|nr:hypothetical protein KUTeg_010353 [Tegillarca granosa]